MFRKTIESWIERGGRVVKRWCRVRLDEFSWLEVAGREEDWYCESSRRLRFNYEVIDRDSVLIRLSSKAIWESEIGANPVTPSELAAISPKLQSHFEREWGHCKVVIDNEAT